jgi:hypothetical protein
MAFLVVFVIVGKKKYISENFPSKSDRAAYARNRISVLIDFLLSVVEVFTNKYSIYRRRWVNFFDEYNWVVYYGLFNL